MRRNAPPRPPLPSRAAGRAREWGIVLQQAHPVEGLQVRAHVKGLHSLHQRLQCLDLLQRAQGVRSQELLHTQPHTTPTPTPTQHGAQATLSWHRQPLDKAQARPGGRGRVSTSSWARAWRLSLVWPLQSAAALPPAPTPPAPPASPLPADTEHMRALPGLSRSPHGHPAHRTQPAGPKEVERAAQEPRAGGTSPAAGAGTEDAATTGRGADEGGDRLRGVLTSLALRRSASNAACTSPSARPPPPAR